MELPVIWGPMVLMPHYCNAMSYIRPYHAIIWLYYIFFVIFCIIMSSMPFIMPCYSYELQDVL